MGLRNENFRFVDLKINSADPKLPAFVESVKKSDGWDKRYYSNLSGKLIGGDLEPKEYQGDKYNAFKLSILDGDDTFRLELNHGEATYAILSSLANCDLSLPVEFKVRKEKGSDGFDYVRTTVLQKGKRIPWSVDLAQIAKDEFRKAYFEDLFFDILREL